MRLQDLLDDPVDLVEALTYRAPPSNWVTEGNDVFRILDIDGIKVKVNIEAGSFSSLSKIVNFLNISFETDPSGSDDFKTDVLKMSNSGSKIIGAVSNAIKEKLPGYEYSALVFVAFNNVDRCIALYSRIVSYNLHLFGNSYRQVQMSDAAKAIIVFSKSVDQELKREFVEFVEKSGKTIG